MALAPSALAATALGARPACGHVERAERSSMTLLEDGTRYCMRCWLQYRQIRDAWRAGQITRAEVATRLRTLLLDFDSPALASASAADINAEVAFATAELTEGRD